MRSGFFLEAMTGSMAAALMLVWSPATAEEPVDADAVNTRLYQQLGPPEGSGRIETVSGQMYLSEENIDAEVIGEALAALRALDAGPAQAVAIRRAPRLNFEINFPKNSARLTEEARANLDELAAALGAEAYTDMRFVLGGHTDQDGDDAVNQPLSQARAQKATDYLVETHSIDEGRLVARGFGSSEPLREVESNPQDKLYNRRVDLRPLR